MEIFVWLQKVQMQIWALTLLRFKLQRRQISDYEPEEQDIMFAYATQFTTLDRWDIFLFSLVILHAKHDCKS